MRESTIQAQVRQAINRSGKAVVTRNNTGKLRNVDDLIAILVRLGLRPFHPDPLALVKRAIGMLRLIAFGLGLGSPDLVGIITASGPMFGRVFCLEVKQPGREPTKYQQAWAHACRKRGGFYAVVHSREQALEALARALRGELQ